MNPLKIKILETLAKHKNKWLKTKTIAKEVGINTPDGISRVSNVLYRLRRLPNIERKRNSHAYQYRYFEELKVHHTNIPPLSKMPHDKKAIGDSDKFNSFTFIEPLPEVTEGYCELCDKYTQISYKAQKDGCLFLLCERHAKAIDNALCGYGGRKWA